MLVAVKNSKVTLPNKPSKHLFIRKVALNDVSLKGDRRAINLNGWISFGKVDTRKSVKHQTVK